MTADELWKMIDALEVQPPQENVTVPLSPPAIVDGRALVERFPDGHAVPPPPPGYAPADAQGIYIANRPWGQIWFALYSNNRIVQMTLQPGRFHSPGV